MAKKKSPFGGGPPPVGTGSSGSSSSSGGSRSSSSSGSSRSSSSAAKTPPKPGAGATSTQGPGKDYYLNYLEYALSLGLPPSADITGLAHQASEKRYSSAIFLYQLRNTKTYHEQFPGIFNSDHSLRFSESTYNSRYEAYRDIARQAGVKFNRDTFAYTLKQGIGGNEFAQKATAIQRIKQNRVVFSQFEAELQREGLHKGAVTFGDLGKFVMGQAPPAWNNLWERASIAATAAEAGLRIGTDITRRRLAQLAQAPGIQQEGDYSPQFAQLHQRILQMGPLSTLTGLGINKEGLNVLVFGGKTRQGQNQQQVAADYQRIADTYQKSLDPLAQARVVSTGQGTRVLGYEGLEGPQGR